MIQLVLLSPPCDEINHLERINTIAVVYAIKAGQVAPVRACLRSKDFIIVVNRRLMRAERLQGTKRS